MSSQSPRDSLQLSHSSFSFPGILFLACGDQKFMAVCVCSALNRVRMVFGGVLQFFFFMSRLNSLQKGQLILGVKWD